MMGLEYPCCDVAGVFHSTVSLAGAEVLGQLDFVGSWIVSEAPMSALVCQIHRAALCKGRSLPPKEINMSNIFSIFMKFICSIYKINWARRTFTPMTESASGSPCTLTQSRWGLEQPWGGTNLPFLCLVYRTRSWETGGGNAVSSLLTFEHNISAESLTFKYSIHMAQGVIGLTLPVVYQFWRPLRAQQSSIPCVNNWQRGEGRLEERGDFSLTASECKCWEYNVSNVTVDPDSEHLKAQRILAQAFTSFKVMWKSCFLKGILIRLINITSFGRWKKKTLSWLLPWLNVMAPADFKMPGSAWPWIKVQISPRLDRTHQWYTILCMETRQFRDWILSFDC